MKSLTVIVKILMMDYEEEYKQTQTAPNNKYCDFSLSVSQPLSLVLMCVR